MREILIKQINFHKKFSALYKNFMIFETNLMRKHFAISNNESKKKLNKQFVDDKENDKDETYLKVKVRSEIR